MAAWSALSQMSIAGVGRLHGCDLRGVGHRHDLAGLAVVCLRSRLRSLSWPWSSATLAGWLAVRTEGIYTIMITLAIAAAFFYFTRQNYVIFNGFSGFNGVLPPKLVRRGLAQAGGHSTT